LAEYTRTGLDTATAYRLWWDVARASPLKATQAGQSHLAIVSWAFAPFHASSAHFPKALTCAADKLRAKYSVLCSPAPATPSPQGLEMLSGIPANATIYRVSGAVRAGNNPDLRPSSRLFPTLDGDFAAALLLAQEGMRVLRREPPSVILAFGPRFANFVAAWYLAQWCGAKLALFYLDEWTVNSPPFVSASDNDAKWERRCLERASFVTFATEGKRKAYREAFPFLAAKRLEVFENGWDPRPFQNVDLTQRTIRGATLTIDFVGVAAPSAPIAPFFDTLARTFEIRPDLRPLVKVRLTGNQPPYAIASIEMARKKGLEIEMAPAVPQSVAIERMMTSDALLLLLNTRYDGVIPQKTYDYMQCHAPILGYGTTSQGADIVSSNHAGIVVDDGDALGLANALDRLFISSADSWNTRERENWASSRNRESIAADLIRALISA
jgi:hypothetical protein